MFAFSKNSIPTGVIVFFKGALIAIPSGWHLCDGTNGTDDLRDKMIICAGNLYVVDAIGGLVTHAHTNTADSAESDESVEVQSGTGQDVPAELHRHSITVGIDDAENMPPYVAKGFIQKL